MSRLRLYCAQGDLRGRSFVLAAEGAVTIGRHVDGPGISIEDALASRQHASLNVAEDHVTVQDLGSSNGTRINGRRIDQPTRLEPGDILSVGLTSLVLEDVDRDDMSSSNHPVLPATESDTAPPMAAPDQEADDPKQSSDVLTNAYAAELLLALLGTMPMAALLVDDRGRVVLANDRMKELCDVDIAGGRDATSIMDQLRQRVKRPQDLHNLLDSNDERPRRLEAANGATWLAWSRCTDMGDLIFILSEGHDPTSKPSTHP